MTDTVTIPLAEADEKMKAIDAKFKVVEEAYGHDNAVKEARAALCDMLAAFNALATEQGAKPLDGGGKGSPPPP